MSSSFVTMASTPPTDASMAEKQILELEALLQRPEKDLPRDLPTPGVSPKSSQSPVSYSAAYSGMFSASEKYHNGMLPPKSPTSNEPYSAAYSGMYSVPTNSGIQKESSSAKNMAHNVYSAARSGMSTASQWFATNDKPQQDQPIKLKRTSYLDGLRGFGALLVYILHHECWGHSKSMDMAFILENGWGFNGQYYFACLPWIRNIFTGGHLAVAVFFVISGYVLAAKPLSLIHSKQTVNLGENLASALFRRWLRLFIPVATLTFLWASSWHVFGIRSSSDMAPERTYIDEIWKWYCDFKNYSFVFNSDNQNAYSFHAWSIPLEFRGSIVIYTTLLALSRCGTVSRLRTQLVLIFYFLYVVDGWYCALFLMGMFLCDTDLLAMKQQLPRFYARIRFESHRPWVIYLLLIIGLYLGGVPALSNDIEFLRNTPGWYYLSFLKPQAVFNFAWFYRFFAAYLVMICIPRLRWLQSFFESSFCQYLGRISFGFYLVHGPILWSIGDRVYAAVGCTREAHHIMVPWYINKFAFPSVGIFGLELNFFAAQMVLLPLTLWTAEIFTRLVDEPSVKLTQWLFKTHTSEEQDFLV